MNPLIPLSPAEVFRRIKAGEACLLDIREPDEYAREHAAGARPAPLSALDKASIPTDRRVIYMCRTGNRTEVNCQRLADRVAGEAFVLEGGLEGWKKAGLPVAANRKAPLELMRQVQIGAGGLVLLGGALGLLVHPGFWGISLFVGAGLLVAGATGFCGLARVLKLMPWNRGLAGA